MSQNLNESESASVPGTPRRVKMFWIIGVVVVLALVLLFITGNLGFWDPMASNHVLTSPIQNFAQSLLRHFQAALDTRCKVSYSTNALTSGPYKL